MTSIINTFPDIYTKLTAIFPDKPWLKTVKKIEVTRREFPGRAGQAEVENSVAFGLTRWERNKYFVSPGYEWSTVLEAMLLAEKVCRLCDAVRNGQDGPVELERRFRGAFQNSDDMRAIRFELHMAAVLTVRQCQIVWPVESNGEETFDLLIRPPNGLPEFELECKSFAGDKGVAVGLADGHRLLEACLKVDIGKLFPCQPGQASIFTINMTEAIDTNEKGLVRLAEEIIKTLQGDRSGNPNPTFYLQHDYCPIVGDPDDENACMNAASILPGAVAAFIAFGSPHQGLRGLRAVWAGEIKLWRAVERAAKRATDLQLTSKRPGAVALQFINDTAESTWTANNPQNKFRLLSDKLFSRDHAAMVVIASDIDIRVTHIQPPYRPDSFLAEFCKFAAFDSDRGRYPHSKLKHLFS